MNMAQFNRQSGSVQARKKQSGFSLVELMVTLVILAILLATGLPAMRSFLTNNKVSNISNEFLSAINYARSEAISRNGRVIICKSAVPVNPPVNFVPSCSTSGSDWENGWIIFQDVASGSTYNGTYDNGTDVLLRVRNPIDGNYTIGSNNNRRSFTFNSTGLASVANSTTMTIAPVEGGASSSSRAICIDSTGRGRIIDNTANCNAGTVTER